MRILCCFKTTPDFDAVPEADWASGAASGGFDFSYIKQEIDPYSESGLELVLRAKDAFLKESLPAGAADALSSDNAVAPFAAGTADALPSDNAVTPFAAGAADALPSDNAVSPFAAGAADTRSSDNADTPFAAGAADGIHLTALTFGPAVSEKALRTLAALGYDECVRIDGTSDPFTAEQTAAMITAYCRTAAPFDLIVLGGQSPDGGNKKTPYLLAEYLSMPLLKQVTDFSVAKAAGRLNICHTALGQAVKESVDLPLVLTIGDIPGALLRVPTLRQRKEASGKKITVIDPARLASEEDGNKRLPRIACVGMAPVESARQGERIEGKTAAETAQILYDKYLRNILEVRR